MSSKRCCVPGCVESKGSHKVLHLFPNPENELDRFRQWFHAIGGEIFSQSNEYVYKQRRVCHTHFEAKYCCRNNRISNIAVPTLHMPGKLCLAVVTETRPLTEIHNLPSTSKEPVYIPEVVSIVNTPEQKIQDSSKHLQSTLEEHNQWKTKSVVTKKGITSSKHQLYKKILNVRSQLSKCRSKIKKQSRSLKAAQKLTSNPTFVAAVNNLHDWAKILILMQFREGKKQDKGRRFSLEEKIVALSILKQSPKCYRFLRKIFVLPAPQTLIKRKARNK